MILLIASLLARLVLVPVFVVAGVAKLANIAKTREMLAGFGVAGLSLKWMAVALPLLELAVAAALIAPPTAFAGGLAGSALLALFAGVIAFNLLHGRKPSCNCFGQLDSAPIGPLTFVRTAVLAALALLVVAAGPVAAATWRLDQFFGVTPMVALAGSGALVALLLLLWMAAAQVMILRRLSAIQEGMALGTPAQALPKESRGLPEGSLAPSFGLSDTRGVFITLEELLVPGNPVVLFFTKPDCPPCAALSNEVDRWQRDYADRMAIVRISDGLSAVEHYALIQARGEVAQAYDCWGTPCAVLVTSGGQIGSPVAQGAAAIRALVRRAAAGAMKIA